MQRKFKKLRIFTFSSLLLIIQLIPLAIPARAVISNPTPDCSAITTCSVTFSTTNDYFTWNIPAGILSLQVQLYGAQGGSNTSSGGKGGFVSGTLNVSGFTTAYVYVGGQNGYNGGGAGDTVSVNTSQNGGGASDIRLGGNTLNDRVVVAGGGGGAGKNGCTHQGGGNGAYPGGTGGQGGTNLFGDTGTATSGGNVNGSYPNSALDCTATGFGGGGGGGAGGGGAGGYGISTGGSNGACGTLNNGTAQGTITGQTQGCFGIGGNAGTLSNGCGGGGGGGWYGGGSGGCNWGSGGGGGSSYLGSLTSTSYTNATRTGNGLVVITYSATPALSNTRLNLAGSVASANKRVSLNIIATVDQPGTVTFYFQNRKIAGCINIPVSAGSAICVWRPIIHGNQLISATLLPSNGYLASSSSLSVTTNKRVTSR